MIYANWEGKVHVGGCEMTAHVMDKHLFLLPTRVASETGQTGTYTLEENS